MSSFLADFFRNRDANLTLIMLNEDAAELPSQYAVQPRRVIYLFVLGVVLLVTFCILLLVMTPLRELVPGYGTREIRNDARLASIRLQAMEDSLLLQQQYVGQLRQLITGRFDSASVGRPLPNPRDNFYSDDRTSASGAPFSRDWEDHEQPALRIEEMPVVVEGGGVLPESATRPYLSSLRLPLVPPVEGFFTRGFDARRGHYAIDVAVEEGTMVRSVGDGYVILADWFYEGGYVISVQHAGGYVSMYKHNARLLKQVGDRVLEREAIALSGNTGEIVTAPHLHFELWHEGLAQDPREFFIGW